MPKQMISRITRSAFLSPVIVEKVITGQILAQKVSLLADKLIALPLWADQHRLLGID